MTRVPRGILFQLARRCLNVHRRSPDAIDPPLSPITINGLSPVIKRWSHCIKTLASKTCWRGFATLRCQHISSFIQGMHRIRIPRAAPWQPLPPAPLLTQPIKQLPILLSIALVTLSRGLVSLNVSQQTQDSYKLNCKNKQFSTSFNSPNLASNSDHLPALLSSIRNYRRKSTIADEPRAAT